MIQFFGGHILAGWPTGWRQPSFLGHHDLAGLSGAAGSVTLLWLALPRPGWGRFAANPALSGVVGLILSGSTAGAIGFSLAALAAFAFGRWRAGATRGRLVAIVCLPLIVVAGLVPLLQRRRRTPAALLRDRPEGEAVERRDARPTHAADLHRLA